MKIKIYTVYYDTKKDDFDYLLHPYLIDRYKKHKRFYVLREFALYFLKNFPKNNRKKK